MRRFASLLILALPLIAAAPKTANLADAARQRAMDRDDSRAQAKNAGDEIARLRQELLAMGAAESRGERTVGDRGARLAALNAAEADLAARMGGNQVSLARLLGALELYRRDPPPALLVSPGDAIDAVNAAILMRAAAPELERRARAFAAEAKRLQALRREVVLADGALFTAESDVADRRTEIERLISEKTALERRLDADAGGADRDVQRLAAEAKSLGQLVGDLSARDPEASGEALRLIAPIATVPSRRFGDPWPGRSRSEGWAWAAAPAAAVVSPADGRVDYTGPLKGWGSVLIFRTANGYHLVLAGLGRIDVKVGAAVSAGEPIGRMAAPGPMSKDKSLASSGLYLPELYLEVRRGDQPVDPARWLGQTTTAKNGR